MKSRRYSKVAYSTVEIIFVTIIIAVLAGIAIFRVNPTSILRQNLRGSARNLVSDLRFARSLAITHVDRYSLDLNSSNNEYKIFDSSSTQIGETKVIDSDITVSNDAIFIFEPLGNTNPSSDLTVSLSAGGDQYDISITPTTGMITLVKN